MGQVVHSKRKTHLTAEEREEVKNLYRYRLLALKDAAQFTHAKIAERFNCCNNTIWFTTRNMELPKDFEKAVVVDRLEQKIAILETEKADLKRELWRLDAKRKSFLEKVKDMLA